MGSEIIVTKVASGYNYTVYIGCNTDNDGRNIKSSANEIVGGWAPDQESAHSKAQSALAN